MDVWEREKAVREGKKEIKRREGVRAENGEEGEEGGGREEWRGDRGRKKREWRWLKKKEEGEEKDITYTFQVVKEQKNHMKERECGLGTQSLFCYYHGDKKG